MQPVTWRDPDVHKTSLSHLALHAPPEKGSFIWRVAHSLSEPGDVALNHDLGVEHVRLGKRHDTPRFEQVEDMSEGKLDIQVVKNR